MRFCMVTSYYPPYHFGGDAVFVRGLARALAARGHSVEVIHCEDAFRLQSDASPVPEDPNDGILVHRLRSRFGPLSPLITQQTGDPGLKRPALSRLLARDFDVVNFHNISLVGGPGVLALGTAPVKLYTLHEHWLLCPTHIFWKNRTEVCQVRQCFRCSLKSGIPPQWWRYTGLVQRTLTNVDAILAPSAYTARQHAAAGIERVRVLNTYAEVNPARETYTPPERPRFVFAGRVTASKGIAELAERFSRFPQFDLDVVGDGDLLSPLRQRYADSPWIRFHGPVPHANMPNYYRHANAIILPSLAPEVFPLCVLEAFACETPAIVSDAGGAPEAVLESGAGFVYRNESQFQEAVTRLATEPALRREVGTRARAAYENTYCERRYLNDYLAAIEGIRQEKRCA